MTSRLLLKTLLLLFIGGFVSAAWGPTISAEHAEFVLGLSGAAPGPFLYLGAKHMFTGYDHLLFLLGVIFFLYRPRDIILYVTLFTVGHSITLLLGVFFSWQVNGHLVDAVIGLSIVYKAFENIKGFEALSPWRLDTRVAVFAFGLCHGLGLATKLQETVQSGSGLLTNLLSFNVGVEVGQLFALAVILLALLSWRNRPSFQAQAFAVNTLLMCAGFVLFGYQITGFVLA